MKGFGFYSILLVFVSVTMLISICLLSVVMVKLSTSKRYELEADGKTIKGSGVEAGAFWSEHKLMLIMPTVLNSISLTLVGLLVVLSG